MLLGEECRAPHPHWQAGLAGLPPSRPMGRTCSKRCPKEGILTWFIRHCYKESLSSPSILQLLLQIWRVYLQEEPPQPSAYQMHNQSCSRRCLFSWLILLNQITFEVLKMPRVLPLCRRNSKGTLNAVSLFLPVCNEQLRCSEMNSTL